MIWVAWRYAEGSRCLQLVLGDGDQEGKKKQKKNDASADEILVPENNIAKGVLQSILQIAYKNQWARYSAIMLRFAGYPVPFE